MTDAKAFMKNGFELAKQFRRHSFNVVVSGTKKETVRNAVENLKLIKGRGKIYGLKCNVSSLSEIEKLAVFAKENVVRLIYGSIMPVSIRVTDMPGKSRKRNFFNEKQPGRF